MLALMIPSFFYIGPLMIVAPPFLYLYFPKPAVALMIVDIILMFVPVRPWPAMRRLFQLWYEPFSFRHNVADPALAEKLGTEGLWICAMHPHGIIPIHAFLWVAFCDQYMGQAYGFGATTDAALRVPLLRQLLVWVSSGSASRHVLQREMGKGQNLFLLPGGVREIFSSEPGRHAILAKRRGLMKLSLQTGASMVPVYVFGANDFYHQLATYGNKSQKKENSGKGTTTTTIGKLQEWISRNARAGFTFFWGQYLTPMPFKVPVTMVLGDPVRPIPNALGEGSLTARVGNDKLACQKVAEPTDEQIEELLGRYIDAYERLFDQYKELAGCPPDTNLQVY